MSDISNMDYFLTFLSVLGYCPCLKSNKATGNIISDPKGFN